MGCYSRELFDNEVGRFITATRDNLPPADLRQITGTWRSASGSLVEVRNNGEAVGLKPSEQAAARGAKVGDVVFSNAHAVGNLIVADYLLLGRREDCPELRTLVQATIRVDRDGTKLTVSVPLYHIDKDSNGNCTVTDKLQRYRLVKWTRVSSRDKQ